MFKVIPSFPNYMKNINGTVINKKFRYMKKYIDRYGYEVVTLRNNKKRYNKTIHSLVMESFIFKRPNNYQINHIDGNKQNNNLFNLEYCTPSQNIKHSYDTGLRSAIGEKNGQSKLTEKEVKEIKSLIGKASQYTIARKYNIDQSTVSNIKNGKLWSYVK